MPQSGSISLWLAVGCGGFAGALARYALSGWLIRRFPMGTLTVNVIGCLLIGLLLAFSVRAKWPGEIALAFWVTGFLGALTTFSTFGYQTVVLLRQHDPTTAVLNIALNLGLGLLGVWLGLHGGETLLGPRFTADRHIQTTNVETPAPSVEDEP